MKSETQAAGKQLYKKLRALSCEQLWEEEAPRFNRAGAAQRLESVALIRAVGVVFSETGTPAQKEEARTWLRGLLRDPAEKIRRYAMTALPKLGADSADEAEVLALLREKPAARERKFVGRTLDKIGGPATLDALRGGAAGDLRQTELKVKASVARRQEPSAVRMGEPLAAPGLRVNLHCRSGLEEILRDEVEAQGKFRVASVTSGLVTVTCAKPFKLGEIYALRCFASAGFPLGEAPESGHPDALAAVMTSPLSRNILRAFTDGALRYRLDFVDKGHQRGAVRLLANKAYAMCPELLNDAREAPWTMAIHPTPAGSRVELSPRLRPDPRFDYRRADVPAASHPPLAAAMARLGGPLKDATIWDPFCGSGLELVERSLLGGVRNVFGTDISPEAVAIAKANFAAAAIPGAQANFACKDFRNFGEIAGLRAGGVSLIITNPPMGKRVPVPNLRGLIADLFAVAAASLRPGGLLVFANPVSMENPHGALALASRRVVDLGGFDCRLEVHRKIGG